MCDWTHKCRYVGGEKEPQATMTKGTFSSSKSIAPEKSQSIVSSSTFCSTRSRPETRPPDTHLSSSSSTYAWGSYTSPPPPPTLA